MLSGIVVDLFGRFDLQQIVKHYGQVTYHYHVSPSIRDLQYIWYELSFKEIKVKHLNLQYSIMRFIGDQQEGFNYNVVTQRCIWPHNYQK